MRRVAITGIGAVTPLGHDFHSSWDALMEGRTGIGPITRVSGLRWPAAGEVRGLDLEARFGRKEAMRYDRFVLYALMAAEEAVADAALDRDALRSAGVIVGSSRGGISSLEQVAAGGRASAFLMAGTTISMAASRVSERFGSVGQVLGISNACASGSNAVGEGTMLIRYGRAETVICGGTEAPLASLCLRGYGAAGALSRSGSMSPFCRGRDGFVLAEGAAMLVLEEYDAAKKRGATIYAEIVGYANTSDAHHPTEPLSEGQTGAINAALRDAGIGPGDVGCISAHATATPKGDRAEAGAMEMVFGKCDIPSYAIKGATGHMLAASGAFEAAVAARGIYQEMVPPTTGMDGALEFPLFLSSTARRLTHSLAVCHSFGFGGVNSVLVLGRA